jgi:2',3'-cyclic-nucleotide 2'-phosphodiesterase (5'-nucleotidase family)
MRVGTIVWASALLALSTPVFACESCEHPEQDVVMTRNVRRMQPDAQNSTAVPRGPLAWGQLNVLHTTDTHGWLEGHIREQNYGADWGDYVSFVKQMRQKARDLDVDLLVVDTGVSFRSRYVQEKKLTNFRIFTTAQVSAMPLALLPMAVSTDNSQTPSSSNWTMIY